MGKCLHYIEHMFDCQALPDEFRPPLEGMSRPANFAQPGNTREAAGVGSASMEFRLLGPFEATSGGEVVDVGGRQRRTLLCVLLVHGGEPMSTDRLVEELWVDHPPPTARKVVQAHIAHLRKVVNRDGPLLEPARDGYVARLDGHIVDVVTFRALVEEARRAWSDDPAGAEVALKEALDLFRGPPLEGVADDVFSLRIEANRLNEARLTATEDLLELQLAGGNASSVVEKVEGLLAEHPLRERAWGLLMLALYRCGRQGEALAAFGRVRQILAAELGIPPSPGLAELEQKILDHDPSLDRPAMTDTSGRRERRRNPYKGLRPFGEDDTEDFFGRDDLIRRLTDALLRRDGGGLVVLAGPSGAGKSSVIRAGVVPHLRETGMDVAVILPGANPTAVATGARGDETAEPTEAGPRAVVVDQAEELFTMTTRPEQTADFLDLVASASPNGVRWLLTIRADFIHQLMLHPGMGRRLEQALVLIPPLQHHEISAAVSGPAEGVGVDVSPELIAEITHDVGARPALLPLMQYALTDSFERLQGSLLDVAQYHEAGGISGTLARRADSILDSLGDEGQDAARRILLRLVTVTDEGEGVRRRVPRDELAGPAIPDAVIDDLTKSLGAVRLITFDRDPATGTPTVEIAHESLLEEWPRLRQWVDQARDDLLIERRLNLALSEWEDADRDPGLLLSGGRLVSMEEWAGQTAGIELTSNQRQYLAISRTHEDSEDRRRRRRKRLTTTAAGAATAVIVSLAVAAFVSQQNARSSERANEILGLVAGSTANLDLDPELSILLALEAVERSGNEVARDVQEALHAAVLESRLLARLDHGGEGIAHVSPTGETFVSSGPTGNTVVIRRLDTLEEVATLTHDDAVGDAVYDAAGDRIATTSLDGSLVIWDAATGNELWAVQAREQPRIPAFSRDGNLVAASTLSGAVLVWDPATGEKVLDLGPITGVGDTRNLEFSPDDALLAIASDDGAQVWSTETGELVGTLADDQYTFDVGFTPDGRFLLTSGEGGVEIWETETWQSVNTYSGHETDVWDFQISRDGTTIASSGISEVQLWDLASLETKTSLTGHVGTVDGIDLTPDGSTLVTSSTDDKTTRLWDVTPTGHHELWGFPKDEDSYPFLAVGPDGKALMAGPEAGDLVVRDLPDFAEARSFSVPPDVFDVAYSPDRDLVMTAGEESGVQMFTPEGTHIRTLMNDDALRVAIAPSGMVAAGMVEESRGVYTWAAPYDQPPRHWADSYPWSLAFHPHQPLLAMSLQADDTRVVVEVWNVLSGELVATIPGQVGTPIVHLEFSSDGEELVTTDVAGSSTVWDTEEFAPKASALTRPRDDVLRGALDPVRPEHAIVGWEGTLRIWNRLTGEEVLALPTNGLAGRVAYSPDGRYVIIGTPNGYAVYVRDVHELAELARSRLTRDLTRAECIQYLPREECPQR